MKCEKCVHLYLDRKELKRLKQIPNAMYYTAYKCELDVCKFKRRFLSIIKKK